MVQRYQTNGSGDQIRGIDTHNFPNGKSGGPICIEPDLNAPKCWTPGFYVAFKVVKNQGLILETNTGCKSPAINGAVVTGMLSCLTAILIFELKHTMVGGLICHINCGVPSTREASAMNSIGLLKGSLKYDNIYAVLAGTEQVVPDNLVKFIGTQGVDESHVMIYDSAQFGMFGICMDGRFGEPRNQPKQRALEIDKERLLPSDSQENTQNKCWCYITTATCEAMGLAVDCEELLLLRQFRDEVMARSERGRTEIARYYETTPLIVRAIDRLENRRELYCQIFEGYIRPAVQALKLGNRGTAYHICRDAILNLLTRYLGPDSQTRQPPD